jgi:hypothetical protein
MAISKPVGVLLTYKDLFKEPPFVKLMEKLNVETDKNTDTCPSRYQYSEKKIISFCDDFF